MKKYVRYVACDGTDFDDEHECVEYEEELLESCRDRNEIRFFNADLMEMDNDNIVCSFEAASVIYIKTEGAYTIAKSLADFYGISLPSGIGFWGYEDYGNWEDLEEILKEDKKIIDHKIEVFEEVKNGNYKN